MKSLWLNIALVWSLGWCPAKALATSDTPPEAEAGSARAESAEPPAAAPTSNPQSGAFAQDQLEQLVAPVALYPDALLMQILMAATYPLEIVQADRFARDNPDLSGDALDRALLEQDWDPSVKSLCTLPSVLKQMSENLDWTQDLGDAFLAQQSELLDTVQRMRGLAYEAGNLQTTDQQVVTQQEDNIIVIQSPAPEVVYVPTYSSTVVYGSTWGYPYYYYPPMYYPPPPGYGLITFGVGVAIGGAIWGDCHWGWGHNEVNIDIDRYNEFNRNTNINADRDRVDSRQGSGDKAGWQHDPSHRKGVNYSSPEVAQRNGAGAGSNRVTKDQARGYSSGSAGSWPAAEIAQAGDRAGGNTGARSSQADRSTGAGTMQADRSPGGNSAYSGSRSPSADRAASSRGATSRGTTSYGGSRGSMRGGRRRR